MNNNILQVYSQTQKIGTLFVDFISGKEVFSFEYDKEYLSKKDCFPIDPNLPLFSGRQYLSGDKKCFGFVEDGLPDRFGRALIKREEREKAAQEKRKPHTLFESDYLMRLEDKTRMGSIRYKANEESSFLANHEKPIPQLVHLNELEQASIRMEGERWTLKDLQSLLTPGSSLGGARPKANVIDADGNLWIAKFPSQSDEYDVELFEKVCFDLAEECGITVPATKIVRLSKYGSTLLCKRFDRECDNRYFYSSAMTMLDARDGDNEDYSFLDLIAIINEESKDPVLECGELFKRAAFTIAVSNCDNHLRNHGFLRKQKYLTLAPMFDINPSPDKSELALSVDGITNILDYRNLLEASPHYGLSLNEAKIIIQSIEDIVLKKWAKLARSYGASEQQIALVKGCFEK